MRDSYAEPGRTAMTMTVGGWLREWIETRYALVPSTLKAHREHIRLHLGLRWCDLDLYRGIGYICLQRTRLHGQELENTAQDGDQHAARPSLDLLPPHQAVDLLRGIIGSQGAEAEPEAATRPEG